jgi:ankyrin repeat protein
MKELLADERLLGKVPEVPASFDIRNAWEVLYRAAHEGWLSILRLFIEYKKTKVNLRDNFGETALHFAARSGQVAVARYLIEHGAEVDLRNNNAETDLHEAASFNLLRAEFFGSF